MDRKLDDIFEKLYSAYFKDLYKYVYRLTYEKNIAEEIVQDTFIEAYRKIEHLAKHENPAGWLYVTARNITKAYLRDYLSIKALLPLENHDTGAVDEENEDMFLSNYLNQEEAKIIIKFYVEKRSLSEMANEYGISLSACKMRLKRARDKLKENYEKEEN
ncbi:MAG TPA: RNA polymerase sigma factor [Clostridiales bacterium]|jgi:RNA polymerase sigma factor (sigma-70 family)|nr:RNA polymerase sigma factor [Clostridiales bacterium]